MFRSIVSRGLPYRAAPLARACRGPLKHYSSSSSSSFNGSNNPKALTLGALVTVGSILFISPYSLRSIFPEKSTDTQEPEKQSSEPEQPSEEAKPTESEQPAESEEPAKPIESEQPAESEEPAKPQSERPESEQAAQPEQPKDETSSQTAPEEDLDDSNQDEKATAYNPDTGEINWDCPCLGGMAHGPCGEEFKAAFSCFVYSEADPKGIDCIDRFQNMQDCFRRHPEHYADQLKDEEEAVSARESAKAEAPVNEASEQSDSAQEQPTQEQEQPAQDQPAEEQPAQEQQEEHSKDNDPKSSESSD